MTHLIDKAAVIAEIERRKYQFVSQAEAFHGIGKEDKESYFAALASNMNSLLSFINTLEVKEVQESSAADKGTAEEIIVNLKRIEQDYLIDLTKEMEWVRSKVQKGE